MRIKGIHLYRWIFLPPTFMYKATLSESTSIYVYYIYHIFISLYYEIGLVFFIHLKKIIKNIEHFDAFYLLMHNINLQSNTIVGHFCKYIFHWKTHQLKIYHWHLFKTFWLNKLHYVINPRYPTPHGICRVLKFQKY